MREEKCGSRGTRKESVRSWKVLVVLEREVSKDTSLLL